MTGTAPAVPCAEFARLLESIFEDDFSRVREDAEAVLARDQRTIGDEALSAALTALAFVAWDQGRIRDARGLLRASMRRADRGTVAALRIYPRLVLAPMLTAVSEHDEAETMITEGRDQMDAVGATRWIDAPAALLACVQLAAGRLEEAVNHAEAALVVAERVGTDRFVPLALSTIAGAALLRGDLDEAARNIEAGRTVRAARTGFGTGTYAWLEARLAEARGGPSAAVDAASSIYDDLVRHKRLLVEEPAAAAWLVRVALGVGDKRRAQMVVACAQQLAADNDGVLSVEIAAIHAHGLFDRAPGALARAAADHRHPWARASAFEDLSGVLGDANPRSGAGPHFVRALTSYEQAGAGRDASRLRRKLRRANAAGCCERPVQGWASLTPTERRVASLVSDGMTNRKVADQMHLSPHTVDFHLRHIFRKLGISSRVELARIVLARIESSRAPTA